MDFSFRFANSSLDIDLGVTWHSPALRIVFKERKCLKQKFSIPRCLPLLALPWHGRAELSAAPSFPGPPASSFNGKKPYFPPLTLPSLVFIHPHPVDESRGFPQRCEHQERRLISYFVPVAMEAAAETEKGRVRDSSSFWS